MALSDASENNYASIIKYKQKLEINNYSNDSKPLNQQSQSPLSWAYNLNQQSLLATINNPPSLSTTNNNETVITHLRQEQRILSDEEITKIIIGYSNGLTMKQLANQFNCHRTTISQKLKVTGITIRMRSPTKEQVNKIITLYESGLSLENIGKIFNMSATTIMYCLKKQGIKTRDSHGQLK